MTGESQKFKPGRDNVGCLIQITPPPKFNFFEKYFRGGQPSYNNFWESIAGIMEVGAEVVEATEEDEEEEKKEKKEKEKEGNKIGVAEKSFHYCHAWCRFVIAILGLAKGVPFVDLFSCFFNKGFIRKSAVW